MDTRKIPELLAISEGPVGLGGCRNDGECFDCCEFNISVFDGGTAESVHEVSGNMVKVQHCSLSESNVSVLTQLDSLTILRDDQWDLRMLLAKIKERRERISNSYTKSCLVDAGIMANRAREEIKTGGPFAGAWVKCASFFLSDALFSINSRRPSPAHMLEITRRLKKNDTNQTFSLVHQILGLERASTSVLARMVKSTMGFSDMVEANGHSKIIKKKYDYLVEHSLLADCYFYLGYVNRNNIMKVVSRIHKNPEYIHVLKVALDMESDQLVVEKQAGAILESTNDLLVNIKDS
ncbi:MAG TPA: hypothetical protein VJ792_02845 [Candidatus Nitrosotalea sp.]|nr:hypothetical protein [Candidatus Nitrosotalea sp.]